MRDLGPVGIAQVCASLRASEWRRITINGRTYLTDPRNVPVGTKVGQEFLIKRSVGWQWATLAP